MDDWIATADQLPPPGREVRVKFPDYEPPALYRYVNDGVWRIRVVDWERKRTGWSRHAIGEPTHWRLA